MKTQSHLVRAIDGIRTRNPQLGKLMRYHCATIAFPSTFGAAEGLNYSLAAERTSSQIPLRDGEHEKK